MKLTFNKNYFIAFIILFLIELATFGDFLVVILLYCLFKSFIKFGIWPIAITTLGIAYGIEFLQLTDFLAYLGLGENKLANIIFGNSFSAQDLVAYTLGIITVLVLEKVRRSNQSCH